MVRCRVDGAPLAFAYVRASVGLREDPLWVANAQGARRAGLLVGAYHYALPDREAAAQTEVWRQALGRFGPLDLPPALDLEETGGLDPLGLRNWVAALLADGAWGPAQVIYTSPAFWNAKVAPGLSLRGRLLWVAHWGVPRPGPVRGWRRWTFWQTAPDGRVDGIAGPVDLDRYHGSVADLRRAFGGRVRRQGREAERDDPCGSSS